VIATFLDSLPVAVIAYFLLRKTKPFLRVAISLAI
jgi:hypothetical protein